MVELKGTAILNEFPAHAVTSNGCAAMLGRSQKSVSCSHFLILIASRDICNEGYLNRVIQDSTADFGVKMCLRVPENNRQQCWYRQQ